MAEIVVGAIITVFCEKLTADLMTLAKSKGIDSQLKKWKKTLPLIQAVLADAGQKQIKQRAVQLWLNDLQDLAYDIDDVLDGLATEALRRELNHKWHASTSSIKVLKFIPNCCTNFTPRNIMYGRKMSSRLDEITTKLDYLFELRTGLGLNVNVNVNVNDERSNRKERLPEETSQVDESQIMGREEEKNILVNKLLVNEACDKNVSVVSIVGMGGIGKTTLAKILYNQEKVKEHFELMAWVCVSDVFDVFNISKAILQAFGGGDRSFSSLDLVHEALKDKLSKKKFLLVLDDVWNEDPMKWERLESPLKGAPGSKILVTTRNKKVTSAMEADEVYNLELLPNEDALSLLAQNALTQKNFDKHPTLKVYGEGIVKKCGRLPLALKTLGKALKGKLNGDEWENLLNSEIWDVQDESGVLPALRVSYYHLQPHLKLVFAYCSLLPKDRVFYKEEVVLWWMAEGFLPQSKSKRSMESLGHEYFEELESKSFFQHATVDPNHLLRDMQYEASTGYSMHDLINDLATSVAGEFCFRLDDVTNASKRDDNFEKFRHFSLILPPSGSYEKLKHLQRARGMRTLLPLSVGWNFNNEIDKDLVELLPQLRYLRVLSLDNQFIREVPKSIGSLKHLRYLNFSNTDITYLPEQVCELYNLQSLLLHCCKELSSLPKSIGKLNNLRHLDLSDTPELEKTPSGISELTSLQTLSKVIITTGATRFSISGLKDLSDLQGRLSILGLHKVRNPIEAKEANLYQKKGLDVLEMNWSDEVSRNVKTEYEVLKALRPHDKLRILTISWYMGTTFPDWVANPSFDQLTELTFSCCGCKHFPTLGHLPSLKKLVVKRMYQVTTLGFELLASTNSSHDIAFPSLEVLVISECRKLVSLGEKEVNLESLKKVEIRWCHMLESYNCSSGVEELEIYDCSSLTSLTFSTISSHDIAFPSLEVLKIYGCDKLVSLGEKEVNLESLKKVEIRWCHMLESYNCSSGVEELEISHCSSLTSLTFSTVSSSVTESIIMEESRFGFHPLRLLHIESCVNLCSFPFPHEHLQSFTSLEEVEIRYCPRMDSSFPCGVWPPNLRKLIIGGLKKPMSEWGLQNFPTSLVKLHLDGRNSGIRSFAVVEDENEGCTNTNTTPSSQFLLPSSLVELKLNDFEEVESLSEVLQCLTALKHLHIWCCPKLKDVPETTSSLTVKVW